MRIRANGARRALMALSMAMGITGGVGCGHESPEPPQYPGAGEPAITREAGTALVPSVGTVLPIDFDGTIDLAPVFLEEGGGLPEWDPNYQPPRLDGRMTGAGCVVSSESLRVTQGFELRCDAEDERLNFEVNWDSGENFHLLDVTRVHCGVTGSGEALSSAGFDTLSGEGTGLYNGVEGARIVFTLTDSAEAGVGDTADLVIFDASGAVVLDVAGVLELGEQQAHRK